MRWTSVVEVGRSGIPIRDLPERPLSPERCLFSLFSLPNTTSVHLLFPVEDVQNSNSNNSNKMQECRTLSKRKMYAKMYKKKDSRNSKRLDILRANQLASQIHH